MFAVTACPEPLSQATYFVDISVQQFDGDGIYAFIYDDTSHVKRLQKMKDKLLVISDNQTYLHGSDRKEEMNRYSCLAK
jgi:phage repressor protein C with HTH and peptisase S24 domain